MITGCNRRLLAALVPLFILACMAGDVLEAGTFRIYLKNKGISPFIQGSDIYLQTKSLLSQRCLQRRAKVRPADSLFSLTDAPIYKPYLDDVLKSGAKVLLQLRWKNYLVVECDSNVMLTLKAKSYVADVTATGEFFKILSTPESQTHSTSRWDTPSILKSGECGPFRYGPSLLQNAMLRTNELHALGELGSGAVVGILDNGFRRKTHSCFSQLNVDAEYDFIFRDSVTANDSNDVGSQDDHGSACLSILAGYEQDSLIGTAPQAHLFLAKTEDMRFERHIEEDNFAAAIEWMDISGVDITSSSVGYSNFDSLDLNYPYSSLDGRTTIAAQTLNHATSLGMICCTAAGNSGGSSRSLITPGDADSAITVGAFSDDSLHVANFTSKGPNASNRLKPDLSTLGVSVVRCDLATASGITKGSGTSFSTPALAGGIALLLSQFPEMRPYELRELLYRNGSQSVNPDTNVGYGLPNLMKAAEEYGIVVSPLTSYAAPRFQYFIYYLRSKYPLTKATLFVSSDGLSFSEFPLQSSNVDHQFVARVPKPDTPGPLYYYIEVRDSQRARRVPHNKIDTLDFGDELFPCGIDPVDFPSDVTSDIEQASTIPQALLYGTPTLQIPESTSGSNVIVRDQLGREILYCDLSETNRMISIATLSRGLYTVEVKRTFTTTNILRQSLLIY